MVSQSEKFPESFSHQSERQANLPVDISMSKLYFLVTDDSMHGRFKKFCTYCNKKQLSGHFCYVAPLKRSKLSDRFMYIFFDTECTQDLEMCGGSFEHVPNLICAQ
jgi:hypothetical protein